MVRYGLVGSILLHILVFGFVIFNFASGGKDDATPPSPLPVEVMAPSDFSERQAGKKDGKAEKAAPPADIKAPDASASAKKEVEPKLSSKPSEREAMSLAPPAEPPAPKPVEQAKVEPPKPPVAKKEPAPKPKPRVVEAKRPDAPAAKPVAVKPAPERPFDPNRIESIIKQEAARDPHAQTSESETPASKQYADRQAAVVNRDPNAGQVGGEYDPNRPWRPASSLQDQAMGLPQARGSVNAGTCADLVQSRIEQNWDVPIGALSAETAVVRLRIELNRDGMLLRQPTVMDASMSPTYQAMADAAVRAALRGQPYLIPPEQYERCRDMVLRFNPREMYGG